MDFYDFEIFEPKPQNLANQFLAKIKNLRKYRICTVNAKFKTIYSIYTLFMYSLSFSKGLKPRDALEMSTLICRTLNCRTSIII